MKKTLLLVFCLYSFNAFAQSGFFLQPEIGLGTANAYVKIPDPGYIYYQGYPTESYLTYNFNIGVGYHFNNWAISSGAGFLRSGFIWHYKSGDLIWVDTKITKYDYQAIVPVTISYQFNISDRFFIIPAIGGAISYNFSEKEITNNGSSMLVTGSDFYNQHTQTNFWGIAKVQFGYELNQRLSILAGPQAEYMLNSMLKNIPDRYQKNYVYAFNAGIRWNLKKEQKLWNVN